MSNNQKSLTEFDEKESYQEEIEPLVKKLDTLCKARNIPYFFAACVSNSDEGSHYEFNGNLCGSNEIVLKEDKITDFVRILCGFKVKSADEKEGAYSVSPPGDEIEIMF